MIYFMAAIVVLLALILITMVYGKEIAKFIMKFSIMGFVFLVFLSFMVFVILFAWTFVRQADIPPALLWVVVLLLAVSFMPAIYKKIQNDRLRKIRRR